MGRGMVADTGLFVNVRVMPATLTRLSGSGTYRVSAEFHPASEARLPFSCYLSCRSDVLTEANIL